MILTSRRAQTLLRGNKARNAISERQEATISDRMFHVMIGVGNSTYGPTPTHIEAITWAEEALAEVSASLETLRGETLPAFEADLIEAGALLMQGNPNRLLHSRVHDVFLEIEHVEETHHAHIWSVDGENHVLTAHLKLDKPLNSKDQENVKSAVSTALKEFSFVHTTIEFEYPDEDCRDAGESDH